MQYNQQQEYETIRQQQQLQRGRVDEPDDEEPEQRRGRRLPPKKAVRSVVRFAATDRGDEGSESEDEDESTLESVRGTTKKAHSRTGTSGGGSRRSNPLADQLDEPTKAKKKNKNSR